MSHLYETIIIEMTRPIRAMLRALLPCPMNCILLVLVVSLAFSTHAIAEKQEFPTSSKSGNASSPSPVNPTATLDWSGKQVPAVGTIDGKSVDRRTKRAYLAPGEHEIVLIDVPISRENKGKPKIEKEYPMSLYAIAGHTYSVRFRWGDSFFGYESTDVWIENTTTGEIAAGEATLMVALPTNAVHMTQWTSLCRSALDGSGEARSSIGTHYQHGWAPARKNVVLAFMWFRLAAKAGYVAAEEYRNDLQKEMTSQQVEKAEDLAESWNLDVSACVNEVLTETGM